LDGRHIDITQIHGIQIHRQTLHSLLFFYTYNKFSLYENSHSNFTSSLTVAPRAFEGMNTSLVIERFEKQSIQEFSQNLIRK
jgi:hypothetical protein